MFFLVYFPYFLHFFKIKKELYHNAVFVRNLFCSFLSNQPAQYRGRGFKQNFVPHWYYCFSMIPRPRRRKSWNVASVERCSPARSAWLNTRKPPIPPSLITWEVTTTLSTATSVNTTTKGTTLTTRLTTISRCPRLKKITIFSSSRPLYPSLTMSMFSSSPSSTKIKSFSMTLKQVNHWQSQKALLIRQFSARTWPLWITQELIK